MSRATPEADLSNALSDWLAYTHPHDNPKGLFYFMVPNERASGTTQQRKIAAGQLKRMGLRPGTADWCFGWWKGTSMNGPIKQLCVGFIELKAGKNRQSDNQAVFQAEVEGFGLRYAVCRSLVSAQDTLANWGAIKLAHMPSSGPR